MVGKVKVPSLVIISLTLSLLMVVAYFLNLYENPLGLIGGWYVILLGPIIVILNLIALF
ncbi:hypothetical protein EV207_1427 [Scopulibacillus darangshiensis]|uniref:Uncharacterized protein n=1 Tax=Scopulibacillus darangshiensis TaxID=442528 RepID=A0A4V2SL08_9BACL|nr:hypothetical protein EV207_1427 [Scopulibacillus darangshiensis]